MTLKRAHSFTQTCKHIHTYLVYMHACVLLTHTHTHTRARSVTQTHTHTHNVMHMQALPQAFTRTFNLLLSRFLSASNLRIFITFKPANMPENYSATASWSTPKF